MRDLAWFLYVKVFLCLALREPPRSLKSCVFTIYALFGLLHFGQPPGNQAYERIVLHAPHPWEQISLSNSACFGRPLCQGHSLQNYHKEPIPTSGPFFNRTCHQGRTRPLPSQNPAPRTTKSCRRCVSTPRTPPRSPSSALLPFVFWGRVPLLK